MGFDEFYAIEAFDEDTDQIRGFVSDRGNYEKIIEVVEERNAAGESVFLFDITMQNHGGYTEESYEPAVKLENFNADDKKDQEEAEQFLSLQKDTDDALEYLIEYFKNADEPTLILVFGDHYPSLPDSFTEYISGAAYDDLPFEEQIRYYSCPFLIWANYDIPEAEGIQTSANYLGTMLLNQTGLEQTWYNGYLNTLMQQIPAMNYMGYLPQDGKFVSWDDAEEPYKTLSWEYDCLIYNSLVENRNRIDWFFAPRSEETAMPETG
ncbi:MAG: sulfatase-like hydrolase/transferase [Eubacterium sp.]|nr:sulfatase-like hydrolase/transferase [Eubacterium sp.]